MATVIDAVVGAVAAEGLKVKDYTASGPLTNECFKRQVWKLEKGFLDNPKVKLVGINSLRKGPAFHFVVNAQIIHADNELQIPTAIMHKFSDRLLDEYPASECYGYHTSLDPEAIAKVIDWLEGNFWYESTEKERVEWWDDMKNKKIRKIIQVYICAAELEIHALESTVVAFLDLYFLSNLVLPDDALMTWARMFALDGCVVREYLLRICYWHIVLQPMDVEKRPIGTDGWNDRNEKSWVSCFHRFILRNVADSDKAKNLDIKFNNPARALTFSQYVQEARNAVDPPTLSAKTQDGLDRTQYLCQVGNDGPNTRDRVSRVERGACANSSPDTAVKYQTVRFKQQVLRVGAPYYDCLARMFGPAQDFSLALTTSTGKVWPKKGFHNQWSHRPTKKWLQGRTDAHARVPQTQNSQFAQTDTGEPEIIYDRDASLDLAAADTRLASPASKAHQTISSHPAVGETPPAVDHVEDPSPEANIRSNHRTQAVEDSLIPTPLPKLPTTAENVNDGHLDSVEPTRTDRAPLPCPSTVSAKRKPEDTSTPMSQVSRKKFDPRPSQRRTKAERTHSMPEQNARVVEHEEEGGVNQGPGKMHKDSGTEKHGRKIAIECRDGIVPRLNRERLCDLSAKIKSITEKDPNCETLSMRDLWVQDVVGIRDRMYENPIRGEWSPFALGERVGVCIAAEELGLLSILEAELKTVESMLDRERNDHQRFQSFRERASGCPSVRSFLSDHADAHSL